MRPNTEQAIDPFADPDAPSVFDQQPDEQPTPIPDWGLPDMSPVT